MSSLHNFINIRNLTLEQQRVYVMYVNQYDLISNQIDALHEMLYDIRANISDLQTNNINNMQNIYNYPNIISHNNNNNTGTRNTSTNTTTSTSQANNLIERFITNLFNTPIINNSQINNNLRPTPEQINNASRLVRYDVIENPSSEMCTISLQEFNDADQVRQILYCGHIFHENSLQEWFTRNTVCPLCRYDIRDYIRYDIQPFQNSYTPNSDPNDINFVLSNFSRRNIDINSPQTILDEITRITRLMIPQNTNENTDDISISSDDVSI
jgi:hypothetical protein